MTRKEQIEAEAKDIYPFAVKKVREVFLEGAQFADSTNHLSTLVMKLLYNSRECADDYDGVYYQIKDEILNHIQSLNKDLR